MLLIPSVVFLFPGYLFRLFYSVRLKLLSHAFASASGYALIHTYSKGGSSWAAWGCILLMLQRCRSHSGFGFIYRHVISVNLACLRRRMQGGGMGTMMGRWLLDCNIHVLRNAVGLLFGSSDYR